jgi:ribosome-associated protein
MACHGEAVAGYALGTATSSIRHDWCMREVSTRDGTIRLGQFLKLADLIDAGGDAKSLLAEQAVSVNGTPEIRRGRQLVRGDVVAVGDAQVRVG